MKKKYQTLIKVTVIVMIVMIAIKLCLIFLWPFLISLLCVFLLEPIIIKLCQMGISRRLSVIISIAIVIVLTALIVLYLSQYMYKQVISFMQNLSFILSVLDKQFSFLNLSSVNYEDLLNTVQNMVISSREQIVSTIVNTFNGFVYTILIAMATIFISFDFHVFKKMFKKRLSLHVYTLLSNIFSKIGKIIMVEMKLIILTTVQTIIGLYIIGINNALTIGLICGILDLLPIVGPATIFGPYIIYEFIIGRTAVGIGLIILYILLQITREFMKVKLVGDNLQMHPFITLLSIYLGILFYGISGVVLGPMLAIVIMELIAAPNERRILS